MVDVVDTHREPAVLKERAAVEKNVVVEPIRSDVTPAMDAGREMLQFVAEKINDYVAAHGEPPASIALVLVGPDFAESATHASSWSPGDETKSRLHCCAVASAMSRAPSSA